MKKTTVALTEDMYNFIKMLIEHKYYPNQSVAIRALIRYGIEKFIKKHPELAKAYQHHTKYNMPHSCPQYISNERTTYI